MKRSCSEVVAVSNNYQLSEEAIACAGMAISTFTNNSYDIVLNSKQQELIPQPWSSATTLPSDSPTEPPSSFNKRVLSSKRLVSNSSTSDEQMSDTASDSSHDLTGVNDSLKSHMIGKYGLNTDDIRGPFHVQKRVMMIARSWMKTLPIAPHEFLLNLLKCRGYEYDIISAIQSPYRKGPSSIQLTDYDNDLVWAIRNSDISTLRALKEQGRCLSACNRFSESIMHMACRRADFNVVHYLLTNGGSYSIVDDFGRTPLHDACWRPVPRFDIVTLLLENDLTLLRLMDVRGSLPLNYVRAEHWLQWCAYLYHQKEKFWSILDKRLACDRSEEISNYSKVSLQESFINKKAIGPLYWEPSHIEVDRILCELPNPGS